MAKVKGDAKHREVEKKMAEAKPVLNTAFTNH